MPWSRVSTKDRLRPPPGQRLCRPRSLHRLTLVMAMAVTLPVQAARAAEVPAAVTAATPAAAPAAWAGACASPTRLPASLTLDYAVLAQRSGLQLNGDSTLQFTLTGERYQLSGDTRAAGGLYHVQSRSEGTVVAGVLRPSVYAEKRGKKAEQVTTLDWNAAQVRFAGASAEDAVVATAAGMQDHLSLLLQLGWSWQRQPQAARLQLPVAGLRRASVYSFNARGRETLTVAGIAMDTLKVERTDGVEDRIEAWLAASYCWLPVRVRFQDADGNVIDQRLRTLTPPAAPGSPAR